LDVVYVYLDAIALRTRCAGKVGSTPVLAAVGVLADGTKQLLALELCGGWRQADLGRPPPQHTLTLRRYEAGGPENLYGDTPWSFQFDDPRDESGSSQRQMP
jgi:hypothetical protein